MAAASATRSTSFPFTSNVHFQSRVQIRHATSSVSKNENELKDSKNTHNRFVVVVVVVVVKIATVVIAKSGSKIMIVNFFKCHVF